MRRQLTIILASAAVAVLPVWIDGQQPPSTSKPPTAGATPPQAVAKSSSTADSAFINEAAMAGMAEVELGRLGAQSATSGDVKQFAQRMVDDHTKANEELKGLAGQKKITLPASLDAKHKAVHDKLAKMKGAEFDRAFMIQMVSDHKAAVSLFEKESKSGKDAETRAWAAKTLPTLQEHSKMAQQLQAAPRKGKS